MTEKKRRMKPYLEEPFTNEKGHVINPGDDVVIVTIRSHSPSVSIGKYLGKRKSGSWNGVDHYNVVVSIVEERTKTVRKDDGSTQWHWDYDNIPGLAELLPKNPPRLEYPTRRYGNYSWNQTPDPEYDRKMAEYKAYEIKLRDIQSQRQKIAEKFKKENYQDVKTKYTRYSTLQCNLIYPINMQLKDW